VEVRYDCVTGRLLSANNDSTRRDSHSWIANEDDHLRYVREFAEDRNIRTQRFYRLINEVPTVLMIVIVVLVVVKPF